MKKLTILAVLALVAGASCTKSIPVSNNSPDASITFSPLAGSNTTKAQVYGEIPTTYNTSEKFQAYAFFTRALHGTTNPQDNAIAAADGSEFFPATGVECVYNGGAGQNYWEPSTAYYWPKAGYLHFHAISPSAFTKTTLTHLWASGYTITGYVAPQYTDANTAEALTDDNQIDLLYSDFVFDKQRSGYDPQTGVPYDDHSGDAASYNGVDLVFRHALSTIKFKVKTDDNYQSGNQQHKFTVRKIEILNAYNTGNFAENRKNDCTNDYVAVADMTGKIGLTSDNADGSATPYWSGQSNEVTLTPYDATLGTGIAASNVVSAAIGTQIIALPQALDHGANKVRVQVTYDYEFSNDGGTNWYSYTVAGGNALTAVLDIAGFKGTYDATGIPVADYVVNNWLINHKYTYVLNFKLDPIIFDPAVTAWVEVDNIGVDLPAQN